MQVCGFGPWCQWPAWSAARHLTAVCLHTAKLLAPVAVSSLHGARQEKGPNLLLLVHPSTMDALAFPSSRDNSADGVTITEVIFWCCK